MCLLFVLPKGTWGIAIDLVVVESWTSREGKDELEEKH